MSADFEFAYFVGHPPEPAYPGSPQWAARLPADRFQASGKPADSATGWNCGDYFKAVRAFLRAGQGRHLLNAAALQLNRPIVPREVRRVEIHLAKHGAFYHPAKVTLRLDAAVARLAVNVALSERGRAVLPVESASLSRLNREFTRSYIPLVHAWGDPGDDPEPPMFAAQWMEDYCEFHLTRPDDSGTPRWRLWDDVNGHVLLTPGQVADLYRQAAFIMAYYFNPLTFEAILDWHHAAGDFTARPEGERLSVRLITVRRYAPLIVPERQGEPSLLEVLDALLLFWINLSLRMRLDRWDGVGAAAWAPVGILAHLWAGFGSGFHAAAAERGLPVELRQGFGDYLAGYDAEELLGLCREVAARLPVESEGDRLFSGRLADHAVHLGALARQGF